MEHQNESHKEEEYFKARQDTAAVMDNLEKRMESLKATANGINNTSPFMYVYL